MRKGQYTEIKIEGQKVRVEYLGNGQYSKAYRSLGDNNNLVYLFTKDDDMKEVVKLAGPSTHIPEVKHIETLWNGIEVYTMPYFRTVTAKNNPAAWALLKLLRVTYETALDKVGRFNVHNGYYANYHFGKMLAELAEQDKVPASIVKDVNTLASWAINYGDSVTFEFGPRNYGVDEAGNLIFRDALYDREKVIRKWEAKLEAARRSGQYRY